MFAKSIYRSEKALNVMKRLTSVIPKAPLGRILFEAKAKRVSQGAMDKFSELLEDILLEIAKEAKLLAEHAKRKTVRDVDVKLAKKKILGR